MTFAAITNVRGNYRIHLVWIWQGRLPIFAEHSTARRMHLVTAGPGLAIAPGVLNDPFFSGRVSMGHRKITIVAYCLAVGFILVVAFYSPSKPLITASVPAETHVADPQ
jgi:hypothetical protein